MAKQTVLITAPDADGNPALLLDEAGNPYSVTFETIVGPQGPQGPSGIGNAKVSNVYGESTTDGYTQDYLNKELDKKQPKGNYLTEHQDISGKADTTYVDSELDKKLDKTESTLQFNQLLGQKPLFLERTIGTTNEIKTSDENGFLRIKGSGTYDSTYISHDISNLYVEGHTYAFLSVIINNGGTYNSIKFGVRTVGNHHVGVTPFITNKQITIFDVECYKLENVDILIKPMIVDLTEMFGAGNEPKSVEEVQKYIPDGTYYPYTKGKASIEQVNSLSMCPSDTYDSNILKKGENYTANNKGYIIFQCQRQGKDEAFEIEYNINGAFTFLDRAFITAGNGIYQSRIYPMIKGSTIAIRNIDPSSTFTIDRSMFIHAKEI